MDEKSYTPVGGLGTVTRYLQNGGYGVKFMVWNVSHEKEWTDAKGNFKPIPEENTKFYISVNKLFGAYPVSFINKPGLYLLPGNLMDMKTNIIKTNVSKAYNLMPQNTLPYETKCRILFWHRIINFPLPRLQKENTYNY